MMESWELAAREAIRDLVAAYSHFGDTGRFDEMCALFAPDGVLELDAGRAFAGRGAIRAFLGDTGSSVRAAGPRPYIRHHVSNHRIEVAGPGDASGAAYFFVVTERGPDHWGRYRDRYACTDEGWRFAHRRVRLDGMSPTSWAAERRAALAPKS
jgi:hypothetical protein